MRTSEELSITMLFLLIDMLSFVCLLVRLCVYLFYVPDVCLLSCMCINRGTVCAQEREKETERKKASILDCYLISVHAKGQGIVLCVLLLMNMINVSGEEGFVFSSAMYETIAFCLLPKVWYV